MRATPCIWISVIVSLLVVTLGSAPSLGAAVLTNNGNDGPRFLGGFVIGNQFTVGPNDISINSLGVWDQGGDGLAEAHEVGLWDASSNLVASVTVPAGVAAVLEDAYRYAPLASDVLLSSGQLYTIGAFYETAVDPFNDPYDPNGDANTVDQVGDGVAVLAGQGVITVDGDFFAASTGLIEPTNNGGGFLGRWGAANALVAVPEPGATLLGGAALLIAVSLGNRGATRRV